MEIPKRFRFDPPETEDTAITRNAYALAVPVAEYLELLVMTGCQLDQLAVDGLCCDNCNGQLALWWDHCNRLSVQERIYVQKRIRIEGHNLPNGPWEDVVS